MQKAVYYIGANNETHELEVEKITEVISGTFDGFTASEVVGYWKGSKERSLRVEVVTDEEPAVLARVAKELAQQLNQESVMLELLTSNVVFVEG